MALTWGAIGTGANGSTTCAPSYPASITAATSKLYALIASGVSGEATPTPPAGWTLLFSFSGGSGATFGDSVGNRRVSVFKKDTVTGSETGTETFSLASGNTMRGHIIRVEVGSGNGISEQWVAAADSTHGTGWSVTAGSNLTWLVGQLALVFTVQSQDTATQSSKALTATGVTFGSLTSRQDTAVTTGNDHRYTLDSATVDAVGVPSAPTYAHTNSANASGPTGFLLLTEQISSNAPRTLFRASSTGEKDPNLGSARGVQRFSRMSLVRGTGARKRGAFQFTVPTTDVAGSIQPKAVETSLKSTSWGDAARLLFRAANLAGPGGVTVIAARALPRAAATSTKSGTSDQVGHAAVRAATTSDKFRSTDVAGRLPLRGADDAAHTRAVARFSRMSLLRGTGARKAGSFQRGGAVSSALGVPVIRGACTAGKVMSVAIAASLAPRGAPVGQKTIAAAIAGRLNPSAAAGTPKIGTTSISATWSRFAADAFVKTGSFAEAGRLTLLGATEFLRDGRTVARYSRLSLALVPADRAGSFARTPGFHSYGRITVRGVETSLKIVSVDELARARFSAAVTAGKFQVFDQSGRIVARGLDTSEKIGETDVAGSALFAAASTGQSITGPTYDMRGRVLVFSQSTNAKSIDDGGGAGLVLDRSSSTAEKGGLTAVAARATFVASLTTGRAPSTNVVTRFVAVAQTTGGLIVLPLGIGRLVPLGSSTFEKIFTSFDHAPRAVFAASSSAEKVMTVDVAGAVGLMRARSTNAPPVVRGRGGGSRPRAIGTSRPPSRGSNRPPNQ